MYETIEYPYSKNSAALGMLLPLVFFAITFNNLKYAWLGGLTFIWVVIGLADLLFMVFFFYVLFTRLIPALRNQVALEFNEEGISDYQRNIIIKWDDMEKISQEFGRSFSRLVIDLKYETDYGSQVAISLRWVAGKDRQICDTAIAYLAEMRRKTVF